MEASTTQATDTVVLAPHCRLTRENSWRYRCTCLPAKGGVFTISGQLGIKGKGSEKDLVLKVRLRPVSGGIFTGTCEGLVWSETAGHYFYPLKGIRQGRFSQVFTVGEPIAEMEVELALWRPDSSARYTLTAFSASPAAPPDRSTFHGVLARLFRTPPSADARALIVGPQDDATAAAATVAAEVFPPSGWWWGRTPRVDRLGLDAGEPSPGRVSTGEEMPKPRQRYALIGVLPPAPEWEWPLKHLERLEALLALDGRLVLRIPIDVRPNEDAWAARYVERFGTGSPDAMRLEQEVGKTAFRLADVSAAVDQSGSQGPSIWLALVPNEELRMARRAMPDLTRTVLAGEWKRAAEMIEGVDRTGTAFRVVLEWLRPMLPSITDKAVQLEKAGERESAAMLRLAMHRLFPTEERFTYEAIAHLRVAERLELARKVLSEAKQSMGTTLALQLQEALLCIADGHPDEAIATLWESTRGLAGYSASFRRIMAMILRAYARECQRANVDTAHPQPLLLPQVAEAFNSSPEQFAARWHATPFASLLLNDAQARAADRKAARQAAGNAMPPRRPIRLLVVTDNWQFLVNLLDHADTHETDFEIRTFDFAFLDRHWSKEHLHELFGPVSMGLTAEKVWRRAEKEDATLTELVEWCDVVFCEWAAAHAIWLSRFLPPHKRLVVRLHSFEAFSQWPFFIDFGGVDGLVYVADHIRRLTEIQFRPSRFAIPTTVLPNFNKLEGFARPKGPQASRTLAMVGYANLNKHPLMAAEILAALRREDPEWRLRLYGHPWEVEALKDVERKYHDDFWDFVRASDLDKSIDVMPYTNDIPTALQDVGFILSCSWREGTHEAVLEGMATGCVPVIRRWPMVRQYGAPESSYPGITCFDTVDDAVAIVRAAAAPGDFAKASSETVAYAMSTFDIEAVFPKFTAFVRQVASS